ncbi:transcriptional regulator, partial [Salmonella enterica subsp. enterica serovar 4,[5],12:i:-]
LRQLFQQHTARWQHELPELTKPQYAVMRVIAEHPGIEQVDLTAAIPLGDRVDDEFLGRLSAEEREQFTQLVRKMMT